MDKSVAQKFMIVMSMMIAVFATVFVCGNIVNGGMASDGYRRPIPKTNYEVSYTDRSIGENNISSSDLPTAVATRFEGNVTIIAFIDDEEDGQETTGAASAFTTESGYDVDEQFLYMTTVTTKGTAYKKTTAWANVVTTITAKNGTTKATTKKTTTTAAAVTEARPVWTTTTGITAASTVRTTATTTTTSEAPVFTATSTTTTTSTTTATTTTTMTTATTAPTAASVNPTTTADSPADSTTIASKPTIATAAESSTTRGETVIAVG